MKKTTRDKNIIIYTLGMKRMYLVESAKVPRNIETFLNMKGPDSELILENVQGYHNFGEGGYVKNEPISEIGIKCGHIDMVAGTPELESLIYNSPHLPRETSKIHVRFGLVPFSHGLIGELKFPSNHIPKDDGKLEYITKKVEMKNFIPFYNPQQPTNPQRPYDIKEEFSNLFVGTKFEGNLPEKILLNRTVHTVNSKAIWIPYEERK